MRVFSPWLRGQYTRPPPQQLQPSRGATHEGPLGRPLCPAPARAAAEPAPLFALATDGRDAGFAQLVNRLARGRVEFVPPLLAPRALHWGRRRGDRVRGGVGPPRRRDGPVPAFPSLGRQVGLTTEPRLGGGLLRPLAQGVLPGPPPRHQVLLIVGLR